MKAKEQYIKEQPIKDQNAVENAWKEYYLMRWHKANEIELKRMEREGV